MNKQEEWNDFLDTLFWCAVKSFETTKEFEYQKERQKLFDEFLEKDCFSSQRLLLEEGLGRMEADAEYKMNLLYRQGFRDCVWLLKNLRVLA